MAYPINNPFRQLYVGESVGPEEFVKLFSPILVKYSLALFQSGNLVIKGFTGAGKSMLLNLLDPEIRIAYNKLNIPFPVPSEFSRFIGAGINLQTSGVSHFGNRPIKEAGQDTSPIYFGDYLNYYVVADILYNLKRIIDCTEVSNQIGVNTDPTAFNNFSKALAEHDCWFGYLSGITSADELCEKLSGRIISYKSYLNFNTPNLAVGITETKTHIGVPISVTASLLRECKMIDKDVKIFIKIDQYEELVWLGAKNGLGIFYQNMIHSLLGARGTSVSYRIGTRHFAWAEEKTMFGTTAPLEKRRTYLEFHLDNEMKRKENSRSWIFPELAEDIFRRRLIANGYDVNSKKPDSLNMVFGRSFNARESALQYFSDKNRKRAVEITPEWPNEWKVFLAELANSDPFSARLAEAWARQKGKEDIVNHIPKQTPYPWDKQYWKKERTEQALIQLASRNNQQLNWSGREDILALSGGNILAFLSICQHIWDVWLRDSRHNTVDNPNVLLNIDNVVQSAGIIEASLDWYNDLAVDERGGKNRKKFVTFLGVHFFRTLIEDKAMSNPGHNGFSLDLEELENYSELYSFLNECVDYGDLYDSPHTSKLKDKKRRRKYYLNPILSPYFKIPYVHTKEPIYLSLARFKMWLTEAKVSLGNPGSVATKKLQPHRIKKNHSDSGSSNLLFDL